MGRHAEPLHHPLQIRLTKGVLDRAEALMPVLQAQVGGTVIVNRSVVIRAAIEEGLTVLENKIKKK
jgi:hypothetical protein